LNKFPQVLVVAFLSATLFLTGCDLLLPSYDARLTGTVANATGGSAVAGSQVWVNALSTDYTVTARTDANGNFSVGVPSGRYEIKLSKSDWGTSHVIGLDVAGTKHINIIQRPSFNPRWSTRPPVINLQGVSDGGIYQDEIPYRVDVDTDNGMDLIYVALGKTPGAGFMTNPRHAFTQVETTGEQVTNPAIFGVRGSTTFEVVVYDKNGNRTHLIRHVTILSAAGAIFEPQNLAAMSVTLGRETLFFGDDPIDPTNAVPQAAPGGANLYVEVSWDPSPNTDIDGYRLYRSIDGENFDMIATVHGGQTGYRDHGPEIMVGNRTSYYVTAFRGGDESAPSDQASTVPLTDWDVRLTGPLDEATGVDGVPVFSWQPTRRVGRHQFYAVLLWDTVTGQSTFWITPDPPSYTEQLTWRWNSDGRFTGTPWETLQSNRVYEWQVAYAVAVDNLDNPTAVSVAANRFGLSDPNIPVTPFAFDTTDNFSFSTGN
jgi:hypothetical protein